MGYRELLRGALAEGGDCVTSETQLPTMPGYYRDYVDSLTQESDGWVIGILGRKENK